MVTSPSTRKFRTISVEQNFQLRIDGFFRPRRESPPVVLEVLPYDLDEIQFGAVRRQIKQECFVFDEPAVQCDLIDPVMNARVVEHDHGRSTIALTDQVIEKTLNVRPFDGMAACGMDETVLSEVQCAHHIASTMVVGLNGMGQSTW